MKVSLFTDAPKHNLVLMKLSTWHKTKGDEIYLNFPLMPVDYRYASILFRENRNKFFANEYGGPGAITNGCYAKLPPEIESCKPDYSLYGLDYSLGYTYRPCPRNCGFCIVTQMEGNKGVHHSIWDFHDSRFNKIALLNNNTFFDSRWKETFEEIWDANLEVIDESGHDVRLVNEEKANALKKTKWLRDGPHFAWDSMQDEKRVLDGFNQLLKVNLKHKFVYILIGYDTTMEEDIYRCQKVHDLGFVPFVMIYQDENTPKKKVGWMWEFRKMITLRYYTKTNSIKKAWNEFRMKS